MGNQQRLQGILSLVGSKSPILTLIQEAKAQSEVSGVHKTEVWKAGHWCGGHGGGAGAGLCLSLQALPGA